MKILTTSFSAGFHAKNNTAEVLKGLGAEFVSWHKIQNILRFDAVYCIGWYVTTMQSFVQHMKLTKMDVPLIIHWAGTDVLCVKKFIEDTGKTDMIDALKAKHIIHFAGRRELINEVQALGIRDIIQCPVAPSLPVRPWPFVKNLDHSVDKLITVYMPPARAEFFNLGTILEVAEKMPEVSFILSSFSSSEDQHRLAPNVSDWGKLGPKRMVQLIEASMGHLRIVDHDGMSLSVIENCLAGRRVICNQPYPGLEPVATDVSAICERIEKICQFTEPDLEIAKLYADNYGPKRQVEVTKKALESKGVSFAK